jgi:hypothetical protein
MGLRISGLRSFAWAVLPVLALVSVAAEAEEHKVAVNVRVGPGLKLNESDLSRIVRGQLGRYGGVVALPEGKTKDAIAEERATTNSKCRSGVLDQKCQLALGSALAASHWLEVTVTRPGKKCEVSLEYLSIVRESSDGGDVVRGDCDRESVALGLERGVETVARKVGWSGAGASATSASPSPGATDEPNDPVTQALKKAEAAKANAAAEAKAREAADRVRRAEAQWPKVRTLANDRSTPVEARLEALRAFSQMYAGTAWAREADTLARSLEAEQARAAEQAIRAPSASPTQRERPTDRAAQSTPVDSKKGLDEAKRSYTDGFQAFMYSDRARAKAHALSCLRAAEYPPCHSLLGRIYEQEDNARESVKHYKLYLELAPNAPDAAKVRGIIANAEKPR